MREAPLDLHHMASSNNTDTNLGVTGVTEMLRASGYHYKDQTSVLLAYHKGNRKDVSQSSAESAR